MSDVRVIRGLEVWRFSIENGALIIQGSSPLPHRARWIHAGVNGTLFTADETHVYSEKEGNWGEVLPGGFVDIVAMEGNNAGMLAIADRAGKRITIVDSTTGLARATIQDVEHEFVQGDPWPLTFGAVGWFHEDLIGFDPGANTMVGLSEAGTVDKTWVFTQVPIPLRIPQDVFALRSAGAAVYIVAPASITVFGDRESDHFSEAGRNVPDLLVPALSTLSASDLRSALESNPSQNLLEVEPLDSMLRDARSNLIENLEEQ